MSRHGVDPALYRERIAGSFPGRLGVEVVSIEDERVEGRLVVDERHLHPGGYVHGGVWVAFADTVAAWGTLRNLPDGHDFTTVELKTNVFAPATTGDVLAAVGAPAAPRPAHPGVGGALLTRATASPPSSSAPRWCWRRTRPELRARPLALDHVAEQLHTAESPVTFTWPRS